MENGKETVVIHYNDMIATLRVLDAMLSGRVLDATDDIETLYEALRARRYNAPRTPIQRSADRRNL